jgi:hypothetical protein
MPSRDRIRPASLRAAIFLAAAACLSWLLAGCAHRQAAPSGFAQYPQGFIFRGDLRSVSPEGVLFTVRTERNKPRADLGFWREALKTRMGQAGYRVVADTACVLKGSQGVLLKLAAPVGNRDYLYWIAFTLSPSGRHILVAEAAGESKAFLARQGAIREAIAASGF